MEKNEYGSEAWAAEHGAVFTTVMLAAPVSNFEAYLLTARGVSSELSHIGTKAYAGNETALTNHAANIRSIGAYILLLEGAVKGLKADPDSPGIREVAAIAAGYLEGRFKFLSAKFDAMKESAMV